MSLKKVVAHIKNNKYFLITTHTNLEGDALGSELAFYRLLRKLGKYATIMNEDNVPYGYDFLPGINKVEKFRGKIFDKVRKNRLKDIRFDCLIILDCSDLARCGRVSKINIDNRPIVNIDHHISNDKFGNINWIEPAASSCSEMIYKLYKRMRIPLDRYAALLLYVGMITDTGSFRYSNTNSLTHKAASELLKYNLDIVQIYKRIYENIPFEDMKLLTKILPNMKQSAKGKIIWFQIKKNMLKNKKLSFDLSEHILSFGRAIKDAEVAVLFKENLGIKDEIRVNFRSQGKVDVNKIARFFGGGGHKTASGATIHGQIDAVRKKVLAKIRDNL